jgi:hypothetical protein
MKWLAAAAVLLAVATGALLHPIVLNIGSRAVANVDDPQFNAWTLWWGCDRLLRLDFAGWWDAPILKPYRNTLAYSDHQFVNVLTALPFHLFSKNPLLVHNAVLLLTFVFSGVAMFALARRLTRSDAAALVGAFIFAFNAYRMHHLIHVQLLAMQFIPLSMLAIADYAESPSWRRLWLAVAACLGLFLSSNYYAAMATVILGPYTLFELWAHGRLADIPSWRKMAAGAAAFAALAAPFTWPYVRFAREMGLGRSESQTLQFSAAPKNWIATAEENRLWGKTLGGFGKHEGRLFPGAAALALAAAGVASSLASRTPSGRRRTAHPQLFFLAAAAAAFALSLGTRVGFLGHDWPGPYKLLYDFVPGYSGMRAPARFAAFGVAAIAVLSVFGFEFLSRRLPRGAAVALSIAICAGLAGENYCRIKGEVVQQPAADPIYQRLRELPREGHVLEIPLLTHGADARHTYATTYHGKTTVNGYSGHFTPLMPELKDLWDDFPADVALSAFRGAGVRYLVVRNGDPAALKAADEIVAGGRGLLSRYSKGADRIYEITGPSRRVLDAGRLARPVSLELPGRACASSPVRGSMEIANETGKALASDRRIFRGQIAWTGDDAAGKAETGHAAKTGLRLYPGPLSAPGTARVWIEANAPGRPGTYIARIGDASRRLEVVPEPCADPDAHKFKVRDLSAEAPAVAAAGARVPVPVKVKNDSDAVWKAFGRAGDHEEKGVVRVGLGLFDGPFERLKRKASLPHDVPPGESVTIEAQLPARVRPGDYTLKVDLVSEREAWFSEKGVRPYNRPIKVVSSTSAAPPSPADHD